MLFLHVPTPFKFFGIISGAVQKNEHNFEKLFLIQRDTFTTVET